MWELISAISGPLLGAVVALVFLVQRNSARYSLKEEQAKTATLSTQLATKTKESADNWARLSAIIVDLKSQNAQLEHQLDVYAEKDPARAGDMLTSALAAGLPHQTSTPVPSAGVPSSTAAGGNGSPPKP